MSRKKNTSSPQIAAIGPHGGGGALLDLRRITDQRGDLALALADQFGGAVDRRAGAGVHRGSPDPAAWRRPSASFCGFSSSTGLFGCTAGCVGALDAPARASSPSAHRQRSTGFAHPLASRVIARSAAPRVARVRWVRPLFMSTIIVHMHDQSSPFTLQSIVTTALRPQVNCGIRGFLTQSGEEGKRVRREIARRSVSLTRLCALGVGHHRHLAHARDPIRPRRRILQRFGPRARPHSNASQQPALIAVGPEARQRPGCNSLTGELFKNCPCSSIVLQSYIAPPQVPALSRAAIATLQNRSVPDRDRACENTMPDIGFVKIVNISLS